MHWQWLFRGGVQLLANDTTVLNTVEVSTDYLGESTENSNSYGYKASKAATGLELSILRTPQSTDALTYRNLRDNTNSKYSSNEALNSAIGISSTTEDNQTINFAARKMDITNISFDGAKGIYSKNAALTTVNDISLYDRIEIIRGATGLMNGTGNPSASINFVRKVPNATKDFTNFGLSAGSWSFKRADLDASYALNEARSIKARLNVASQKGGSYLDRYEEKKNLVYGVVDFNISDSSILRLGTSYIHNKTNNQMNGNKSFTYSDGTLTNFPINYNFAPNWAGLVAKNFSSFAKFQHFFENDFSFDIDYIYENSKVDWLRFWSVPDDDSGKFSWAEIFNTNDKVKANGFNIKLNGIYNFAGFDNEFITGLEYTKTVNKRKYLFNTGSEYIIEDYNGYFFNNIFPNIPSLNSDPAEADKFIIKQKAIYLTNKTNFNDKFSLILGARLTKHYQQDIANLWGDSYEMENTKFSKYLGFVYEYMKGHSTYISMTDIFTPQTNIDKNKKTLDPELGTNYELGLKSEFFDGNLMTNFSLFEIKRNNVGIPIGEFPISEGRGFYYMGVDGAKNRGFEIGASGKITNDLSIYAGYTHTTAKDASGKDIFTHIPSKTLKLAVNYESFDKLSLGGNIRWQNSAYNFVEWRNDGKGEGFDIPSFAVINLNATYKFTPKLKVQANLNNAFNKRYITGNWGNFYTDGEPRNFMFRAEYVF